MKLLWHQYHLNQIRLWQFDLGTLGCLYFRSKIYKQYEMGVGSQFDLNDLVYSLNNQVQVLNNSKMFTGLMILTLNIASRFVNFKMSKTMEAYLKFRFSKYMLIFAIAWMGVRDIYIALFIVLLFIVITDYLLDEESMFYILPEEFKDYHISMLENESEETITPADIKKAEETLAKAKKQTKKIEYEGYSMK